MGKKYYCEYCDKSMVATPSIVKTHNKGVAHQKLVNDHYLQFKDPEAILNEERLKRPCAKFPRGECHFGSICRYSHYTSEDLNALKQLVSSKYQQTETQQPSFQDLYQKLQNEKTQNETPGDKQTILYDGNGLTHILPWTYNPIVLKSGNSLPPSLRKMELKDFTNININEWG